MLVQALVLGIAAAAPFANAQPLFKLPPIVPIDKPVDICSLPAETGNCRAAIPRYAYDPKIGKCKKFSYGGCGGNANNFETLKECEAACVPPPPPPPTDICKLPKVVGPCKAAFKRYYYNPKTGKCVRFTFGGCRGNANNFKTLKECEKACQAPPPPPPPVKDICKLPKVVGPCKAAFKRYYYNPKTGKCVRFIFGGCRGNANNFKTLKECKKVCSAKPPKKDICKLRLKTGPCRAKGMRWGFSKGKCVKFVYGGCRGNANRFKSKAACEKACPRG